MRVKFMKGLLLAASVIALALSATVFMLSYPIISSASPSLVMDALEKAGGLGEVVGEILEREIPNVPVSNEDQRAIIAAAKAALTPAMICDLTDQVISGFKRYVDSVGTEGTVLLNLRALKASFFEELGRVYPQAVDRIEEIMEEVPDSANIAGFLPIDTVRQISRPYRIATNIPLVAVVVGAASLLLLFLVSGLPAGIRMAGWTLLVASVAVLGATFVGVGWAGKQLPRLLGDADLNSLPIRVNLAAMLDGVTGFVLTRARLVGGACAAGGAVLTLLPGLLKRKTSPDRPTS